MGNASLDAPISPRSVPPKICAPIPLPGTRGLLLGFNVCLEDRVHARKMSLSFGLEPHHNISVEAKMNGSFASRHDDMCGIPEVGTERLSFGRMRTGSALAAFAAAADLARGMSHEGRFLCHLFCSLSCDGWCE
jgi:hypothetical protein